MAVLGHQPDPRARLPAGGRALGGGPRPLARRRRRGRDRRLRAARTHRAERPARGGDGRRRPGRARSAGLAPRRPRPRRCRGRAAARRPGAGEVGRVRPVGAGDGRDPPGRAVVAGRPGAVAAAVARRGRRGAGGGPAGVHAAGRRRSPARSAWSPSPPTWSWLPPSARPPCSGCSAGWSRWCRPGRPAGRHGGRLVRRVDRGGRPARRRPARRGARLAVVPWSLAAPGRATAWWWPRVRSCCGTAPRARPPACCSWSSRGPDRRLAGLAAVRLALRRVRRRPGRRAGPPRRAGRGRRRRRRPRPAGGRPLPRRLGLRPGAARSC